MRPVRYDLCVGGEELPGAIQHGAELIVAGDSAVGDGDIFSGARVAEGEAGLGTDAVIPRRVDGAVGDVDVAAAVQVHAVAVGIDGEVVDGEVIDAGEEQAEVAAFEDGEVTQDDIAAVLERDGFVADSGLLGAIAGVITAGVTASSEAQALAEDQAGAGDGKIVDVFAPEERNCASDCDRNPGRRRREC